MCNYDQEDLQGWGEHANGVLLDAVVTDSESGAGPMARELCRYVIGEVLEDRARLGTSCVVPPPTFGDLLALLDRAEDEADEVDSHDLRCEAETAVARLRDQLTEGREDRARLGTSCVVPPPTFGDYPLDYPLDLLALLASAA